MIAVRRPLSISIVDPTARFLGSVFGALDHSAPFSGRLINPGTLELTDERMPPSEVDELVAKYKSPWIGEVPKEFMHPGLTQEDVFVAIDSFVKRATKIKGFKRELKKISNKRFKIGGVTIHAKLPESYTSPGNDMAGVFKIELGGKRFKLKIFERLKDQSFQRGNESAGVRTEIADGIFFTTKPTCNMTSFYFGNPEAGWTISEWFEPGIDSPVRPGLHLYDAGFVEDSRAFDPDSLRGNSMEGVVIDHGRIREQSTSETILQDLFLYPGPPISQTFRFYQLENIPKERRKDVFIDMIRLRPDQVSTIQYRLVDIPVPDRLEALRFLLHSSVLGIKFPRPIINTARLIPDMRYGYANGWGDDLNYAHIAQNIAWRAEHETAGFDKEVEQLFG